MQSIYFYDRWGRHMGLVRGILLLILFAAIAQFASFGIIQAHVVSFYGAQPEDISFAFQAAYVGIISILPVMFRLIRFFNTRTYLLTVFLAGIALNIGCFYVQDLLVFAILRFFIGICTGLIAGCILVVTFSTLPPAKSILVGVSLFFSLILTAGLIIGIAGSRVILTSDWTVLYNALIGLQVMALVLCLLIFKARPARRSYPLYQIDWIGFLFFVFGATAAAYVMIYGPKVYWFESRAITYTALFGLIMIGLFLYRQSTLKRPLIELNVFRSGKFLYGLVLMLLFYGIRDTINLLYGYAVVVLNWSAADVVNAGLYNVLGVIIATFVVVKAVAANKLHLPKLLLAGFAVLFGYHWWVYQHLTPDLSFAQMCIPIFLQGLACGLLFVPVTILCLASIPQSSNTTGIVICTYARFIAVLNSIAGFYSLQLYFNQHYKQGFLGKLTPGAEVLVQQQEAYAGLLTSKGFTLSEATGIGTALIAKASGIQSQLLTIRAIFLIGAWLSVAAFASLVVFGVINKVKTGRRSAPTIVGVAS
ncbi:MFS transporter [Paraflavitalea sp. CAU 1676]|uniref:MFS transporter n=1 Tax=Paraflavitalea sp. CAU 1676 TaxID=3032598 RepID=UPI0023DA8BDC|nr:MFS transporter [Paraflavitalea sp. CAU 1676]MDF2187902.1 MFS transporter [Paraflavitalea sp. CAU 1676]